MFRATFNPLPRGPLAPGAEVPVELGRIFPEAAPVSVIASPVGLGNALAVSTTGVVELRFKDYPAGLPPVNGNDPHINGNDRYDLVVQGAFTASAADAQGARFGLETNGGSFFEFFSFGPGGQLTRDGAPLGLTYEVSSTVQLLALVHLADYTVDILVGTSAGSVRVENLALPGDFTRETLSHLQYEAQGGAGDYTIDDVTARVDREAGLPAEFVFEEPEIELERENGFVFIDIKFDLENKGGKASYVFLFVKLEDLDVELADLSWLEGEGYVVSIEDGVIQIGLGLYNEMEANGKLKFKLKFKVKDDGLKLKVKFQLHLEYNDASGLVIGEPMPVEVDLTDDQSDDDSDDEDSDDEEGETVAPRLSIEKISVKFKGKWEQGGGLRIYGFPLTEPVTLDNGVIVQYFERARFEYHPELAGTEYEVLLGLLAVELGYAQPPAADADTTSAWYFAETGHTIDEAFRAYWQNYGGLYTFGYPITEAFVDSNGRLVQYFERARMELHPENAGTEYEVLLGFLGEEALAADRSE